MGVRVLSGDRGREQPVERRWHRSKPSTGLGVTAVSSTGCVPLPRSVLPCAIWYAPLKNFTGWLSIPFFFF